MTRDEIMAMQPGPELDNALAPLLGFTVEHFDHNLDGHYKHCTAWKTADGASVNPIPLSTSWEGMRLITEAMAAKGWRLELWASSKVSKVTFYNWRGDSLVAPTHQAETAPHAVCLAALLAMEGEHAAS